ncbi:hypothetical protein BCR34DRAFT_605977 [Clohesyomyces aquaticus]|uniref:GlcNAc-PI de-N-acetylase-domain-containing protein n=1 Tax=Clohesyomyces aquaticus TaxID=1231657 RepID=A0A1Y1YTR3_9PLEO|nr:hypothetical protein BCR34DRAFT_605977 [Clohesyomyces aquaticus]
MIGLHSFVCFVISFLLAEALILQRNDAFNQLTCSGGSIYFSAHPADSLLYHNPDLFHDFYVFKCITTVLFTSGDRGNTDSHSLMLEGGLEDAYSFMAGTDVKDAWNQAHIQFNGKPVLVRFLKDMPQFQIMYLRLPSGSPDGKGYQANFGDSLRRLYEGDIKSLSATDGSSTYTLESLQALIASILKKKDARHIRVLDFKTPLPHEQGDGHDHADHITSARIVADAWKQENLAGTLQGYAANALRRVYPNLNITARNYRVKLETFFQYAAKDKYMCKDYDHCLEVQDSKEAFVDEEYKYVATYLQREHYVSSNNGTPI